MYNTLPSSARKVRAKALARNVLFNRFCTTPGKGDCGVERNSVTPSPVSLPQSSKAAIDGDNDDDSGEADLHTLPYAAQPILVSDSQSSYDAVSAVSFVPHDSRTNPTPYLLVHSTDARVVEVNRIVKGEGPVAVYQSGLDGECRAICPYDVSPTEFRERKSSTWRGSLALGFSNGKLECIEVENVGGEVKTKGKGGFLPEGESVLGDCKWSFGSWNKGADGAGSSTGAPPFFAASLSGSGDGEAGVLSLYDARDLKAGQPVLTNSVMKGIEVECERVGADRYVRGFGMLDDRCLVTTHDVAGEGGKGVVLVWDARMIGSGIASTCEDHFQFEGQCKGALEVGRAGPGHFAVGGMGQEAEEGAGGVTGRVLGLHLGRRQIWDVNSAVNVKNGLWSIARGGEFYVSVVGVKDNEFDEDVCIGGLNIGVHGGGGGREVGRKRKLEGLEGEGGGGENRIAKLGKGHEYTITNVAFADDDTMFATGDSFGHLFVHKAWSGGEVLEGRSSGI
ncbi:hypothetical protein TrST_g2535 [Triparma strigata]|uniref:Uncharacterized protein n=1 Tax=Triparma strigata TaxID=1606541 RepID=A0A9W7ALA3_9STRA|nr:hypothetical protein TrST_g2535 [Triparma strigata]